MSGPYPTIICEMERPEIKELIRRFVLFSSEMKPFKYSCGTDGGYFKYIDDGKKNVVVKEQIKEGLETIRRGKDNYGFLYILVNNN